MKAFRHIDEVEPQENVPGIQQRVVFEESGVVVKTFEATGEFKAAHSHPEIQITLITAGSMHMIVGDEEYLVRDGTVVTIPANIPHGSWSGDQLYVSGVDVTIKS